MSIESLIPVPSFLTATTYASRSSSDDCGHICESSCQLSCEKSSQCSGCQGSACEHGCQNYCQNSGQCGSCESTCEDQGPCIGGQGLPCGNEERGDCGGCEDGCQDCQTSCQNSCQNNQGVKVTCTKISYFYNKTKDVLLDTTTETEGGLTPGSVYTPSAHMPSYDSKKYTLYKVVYSGITLSATSSITCPSSSFTLYYYFYDTAIEKWSWTSSNGSATDEETQAAYYAIMNKGLTSKFSHLVWNDMVNKAKAVLDRIGNPWNATYATYADTLMSDSDTVLTATRFNSLRHVIGIYYSTGISEVAKGDPVLGSYFIILANSLNGWIDNVNS